MQAEAHFNHKMLFAHTENAFFKEQLVQGQHLVIVSNKGKFHYPDKEFTSVEEFASAYLNKKKGIDHADQELKEKDLLRARHASQESFFEDIHVDEKERPTIAFYYSSELHTPEHTLSLAHAKQIGHFTEMLNVHKLEDQVKVVAYDTFQEGHPEHLMDIDVPSVYLYKPEAVGPLSETQDLGIEFNHPSYAPIFLFQFLEKNIEGLKFEEGVHLKPKSMRPRAGMPNNKNWKAEVEKQRREQKKKDKVWPSPACTNLIDY